MKAGKSCRQIAIAVKMLLPTKGSDCLQHHGLGGLQSHLESHLEGLNGKEKQFVSVKIIGLEKHKARDLGQTRRISLSM